MDNTRNRQPPQGDAPETSMTAPNRSAGANATVNLNLPPLAGMPPIFGIEQVPRVDLEDPNPVVTAVTPESRMMETMLKSMHEAMAKQQELFTKMLEDRDARNRRPEIVADSGVNIGFGGGTTTRNPTNPTVRQEVGHVCSFKTFQSCKPPEFRGDDDPIVCMNWIREMEQAFRTSGCGENQKAMFGSQMLRGATLVWWNVYSSSTEASVL